MCAFSTEIYKCTLHKMYKCILNKDITMYTFTLCNNTGLRSTRLLSFILKEASEKTHCRGRISVQLATNLTGLYSTKQEDLMLFVCSKVIEFKQAKLEAS